METISVDIVYLKLDYTGMKSDQERLVGKVVSNHILLYDKVTLLLLIKKSLINFQFNIFFMIFFIKRYFYNLE